MISKLDNNSLMVVHNPSGSNFDQVKFIVLNHHLLKDGFTHVKQIISFTSCCLTKYHS